jgi:hypothetical protein
MPICLDMNRTFHVLQLQFPFSQLLAGWWYGTKVNAVYSTNSAAISHCTASFILGLQIMVSLELEGKGGYKVKTELKRLGTLFLTYSFPSQDSK